MVPAGDLMKHVLMTILLSNALLTVALVAAGGEWQQMREQMIEEIKQDMYQARHYTGREQFSQRVLNAMARVKRHEFVPEHLNSRAYGNYPLPIGDGQTISQPFIVALMTELLDVEPGAKVLEIGTGSGYQAAVLAEIVGEVFSVEIVASLARSALTRLVILGYDNIQVRYGDGMLGWPEEAPFDGIIVTAAGVTIPDTLLDQLAPGGRLIMPVGAQDEVQQLRVITKSADLSFTERDVLPVRFVPITDEKR
jgi:protein-L-isoaspartate(D-aspartate) O-methyltransferase|tara:strand:- start:383 stop:1138 length:756 start_codon:yes stop_codon:yes gene_type:complete